jgi:hypothetical protein
MDDCLLELRLVLFSLELGMHCCTSVIDVGIFTGRSAKKSKLWKIIRQLQNVLIPHVRLISTSTKAKR